MVFEQVDNNYFIDQMSRQHDYLKFFIDQIIDFKKL